MTSFSLVKPSSFRVRAVSPSLKAFWVYGLTWNFSKRKSVREGKHCSVCYFISTSRMDSWTEEVRGISRNSNSPCMIILLSKLTWKHTNLKKQGDGTKPKWISYRLYVKQGLTNSYKNHSKFSVFSEKYFIAGEFIKNINRNAKKVFITAALVLAWFTDFPTTINRHFEISERSIFLQSKLSIWPCEPNS